MSNRCTAQSYYNFTAKEVAMFEKLVADLEERLCGTFLKQILPEFAYSYDTINTSPFAVWFVQTFKDRGVRVLRKIGGAFAFTKSSYTVIYQHLRNSYFAPLFFEDLSTNNPAPVVEPVPATIRFMSAWEESVEYFTSISKSAIAALPEPAERFAQFVEQHEPDFSSDPVFCNFLRQVPNPLRDLLTRLNKGYLILDAYLIKTNQRNSMSDEVMFINPSRTWQATLDFAAETIHATNTLKTFVTFLAQAVDSKALDIVYQNAVVAAKLTVSDIVGIYTSLGRPAYELTPYKLADQGMMFQLLNNAAMNSPELKTACLKLFSDRGVATAVCISDVVKLAKQIDTFVMFPDRPLQPPPAVTNELATYLAELDVSQSTIDYLIKEGVTMTKFKRWPISTLKSILGQSQVPLAERGDILAGKQALGSN